MPHSHHSHSGQYCAHAQSTLDAVVARAHSLGFTTYALSEHVPRAQPAELYPEEVAAGIAPATLLARFHAYLAHARTLQAQYAPRGMDILVGCESENTDGTRGQHLPFFHRLLASLGQGPGRGSIDYIVGSVHHVHSVPIDFDLDTFHAALNSPRYAATIDTSQQARHAALMLDYLDAQHELLSQLRPEVIGHFDLCRLYYPHASMGLLPSPSPTADEALNTLLPQVAAKVERNIRFAASYGALFELNAASFRKGWDTSYPGRDIVNLILALHGRLCLSDDSHGTHQVGLNYPKLKAYLLSLNPSLPIWYLRRRCRPPHPPSSDEDAEEEEEEKKKKKEEEEEEKEEEEEETKRKLREQSPTPGKDAPTLFPRGTQAVLMPAAEWTQWAGWERIAQEQERAQEQEQAAKEAEATASPAAQTEQ
ncbi:hypothetical protein OC834_000042 [Tilletia horrida]|nr:hypothetical protein OC834_000042 [Tilletia horrida]